MKPTEQHFLGVDPNNKKEFARQAKLFKVDQMEEDYYAGRPARFTFDQFESMFDDLVQFNYPEEERTHQKLANEETQPTEEPQETPVYEDDETEDYEDGDDLIVMLPQALPEEPKVESTPEETKPETNGDLSLEDKLRQIFHQAGFPVPEPKPEAKDDPSQDETKPEVQRELEEKAAESRVSRITRIEQRSYENCLKRVNELPALIEEAEAALPALYIKDPWEASLLKQEINMSKAKLKKAIEDKKKWEDLFASGKTMSEYAEEQRLLREAQEKPKGEVHKVAFFDAAGGSIEVHQYGCVDIKRAISQGYASGQDVSNYEAENREEAFAKYTEEHGWSESQRLTWMPCSYYLPSTSPETDTSPVEAPIETPVVTESAPVVEVTPYDVPEPVVAPVTTPDTTVVEPVKKKTRLKVYVDEKELRELLEDKGVSRTSAADRLGISYDVVVDRIARWGIKPTFTSRKPKPEFKNCAHCNAEFPYGERKTCSKECRSQLLSISLKASWARKREAQKSQ